MPLLLLGLGSLAGLFLDNFLDASPSPESLRAQTDLARAKTENLDKVKSIVQTLAIIGAILIVIYVLMRSGVFKS